MKHIISLGAGVQSSTMALMAAAGEITPMPDAAIFADTQNEPMSVYTWLDWLEPQLPFPVYRVTAGNLGERMVRLQRSKKSGKMYTKSLIPVFIKKPDGKSGMLGRRCTTDYKLVPIIRQVTKMVKPPRAKKGVTAAILATQWIGISWDEADRMKPPLRPWIENRWPFIERKITRAGCLSWMKANGFPEPPRSACVQCPYHNDAEWVRLQTQEPQDFMRAVAFEHAYQQSVTQDEVTEGIPFLHDSLVPLEHVKFDPKREDGTLNLFRNECEGMCGV